MTAPTFDIESEGDEFAQELLEAGEPLEEQGPPPDPSGFDGGWWLTEPDGRKIKKAVLEEWRSQDSIARRRHAKGTAYALIRSGIRGVEIVADEDEDVFTVRAPFSSQSAKRAPGKSDGLIRRIAATLTVDPPAPDVTPTSDDDDEKAAAELTERVLKVEGAPSQRDDVTLLRTAIDQAGTRASMFLYTYLDPQAQLVPLEIKATRTAETTDDALFLTIPTPPVQDPFTGEMVPQEPQRIPATPDMLIDRYVRIDGTLTDVQAEARLTWQGEVREVLLPPACVRLLPAHGPTHVEDALGMLVGRVTTLADVIATYYNGERPSEDVVKKLTEWKPDGWKDWIPKSLRDMADAKTPTRPDGTVAETALVPLLCLYWRSSMIAPHGAYLCIGGPDEPIYRDAWRVTIGEGAEARVIHLPLPAAQMRWREDTDGGDPFGVAAMEDLAPAEDIRSAALKYALDYMYRFSKPWAFLPFGSTVTPEQMANRDPVYVDPGSTPFFEPLPPFSPVAQQMYMEMGTELQADSGLNDATATGKAPSNVTSGKQMQELVEQSLVALAGVQQNANRFICRVWSNRAQFMRAFYDTPRVLDYLGEGGETQRRAWMGVDLVGAGDIQIARGTGTMLPRSAKAALAREELQLAQATGDQFGAARYYKSVIGNTTPLVGLQDDPHRARIARQLRAWREAAFTKYPEPEPPQMDPTTGQPMPAPDPVAQQAAQLFAPNPADVVPAVAQIRFMELVDAVSGRSFNAADPRYQQALVAEFERMRQAAGVQTLQEQQQAQQAAAQSAQQAEAAKEQAKVQARVQEKIQTKQAEATIDAQQEDRRMMLAQQAAAQSRAGGMVGGSPFPEGQA